jgi:hypothetical protein
MHMAIIHTRKCMTPVSDNMCEHARRDSRREEVKAWRASTLGLIDSHVKHCFLHPHGMFGSMYV